MSRKNFICGKQKIHQILTSALLCNIIMNNYQYVICSDRISNLCFVFTTAPSPFLIADCGTVPPWMPGLWGDVYSRPGVQARRSRAWHSYLWLLSVHQSMKGFVPWNYWLKCDLGSIHYSPSPRYLCPLSHNSELLSWAKKWLPTLRVVWKRECEEITDTQGVRLCPFWMIENLPADRISEKR